MPLNPHIKGGADIPVGDGGTGASTGSAGLSNLGGLDEAAHDILDHAGLTGVGDLTVAAHDSTDHSGITGVAQVSLGFGGNFTLGSSLAAANGDTSVVAPTVEGPSSQITSPIAGATVTVTWRVTSSGGSLTLRVNGSAVGALIVMSGVSGVNTQVRAIAAGNLISLAHVSGTAPGPSNFQVMIS